MRYLAIIALLFLIAACSTIPQECRQLEKGEQQNLCILKIATEQKDQRLCDKMSTEGYLIWCLNDVAKATNSTAPCDNIADAHAQEFCRRDIFLARDDTTGCAQLTTEKNSCYDAFARQRSDWQLCRSMEVSLYRDTCFEDLSRQAKDPYGCVEMQPENENREGCIFSLSIASGNVETCQEITTPLNQAFCILNIAVNQKNPALCDRITSDKKSLCEQLVADAIQNATASLDVPAQ